MMRNKKLILKTARIQEMASEDVKKLVGEEKYQKIKSSDRHPFFVELLVAHEGISSGKILGAGQKPSGSGAKKFWSRERIEELVNKLKSKPVPVYLFHDRANRPRPKIGEIASAIAQKVRGRLSALAYAYISDLKVRELIRKKKLDTCSLEADLVFEKSDQHLGLVDWIVNAIEAVGGLALGSRRTARPGFPGAAILAQVEEFEDPARLSDTTVFDPEAQTRRELVDFGELSRAAGSPQAASGSEEREIEDIEKTLSQKEDALDRMKSELASYRKEREREERKRKVVEIVDRHLADRNLKREERKLILENLNERIELKDPEADALEQAVKDELNRELGRLAELRRLYQRSSSAPAPLESEKSISKNDLIPKD